MATRPMNVDLDFLSAGRISNLLPAVSANDAVVLSQLEAAIQGLAWKDDVIAASTGGNVNLASPGASLDGVTLTSGDRILLKDQTAPAENGIYVWTGAAAALTRAVDASTGAELSAAVVTASQGTTNAGTSWRQSAVVTTIDTDPVTFASFGASPGAATTTSTGVVELATQTEVDTGTDTSRVVTPETLANSTRTIKRFAASFGDGVATSFNIVHNIGQTDVDVVVWETTGTLRQVDCEVRIVDANTVQILTNTAIAANAYRAVVKY